MKGDTACFAGLSLASVNPLPVNPKPQNPKFGAVWFDDAGEMFAWDGSAWVAYEDLPAWPGGDDPDPFGVIRDI